MTVRHAIRRGGEVAAAIPVGYAELSTGFRCAPLVDAAAGSVHQTFGICELDPGGSVDTHLHSIEHAVYALSGPVVAETPEGAFLLQEGDYGVIPVAMPHAWRNPGSEPARWVEMRAPQPRSASDPWPADPVPHREPVPVDARDPRNRSWGTINAGNMDVARQTQDLLATSASMRTALLVYSGITVKMMVDADFGAALLTMFMVQYEPGGYAGAHDHPFEESFLILEGEVDGTFDGQEYRLRAGDLAWAGVGCVHQFSNPTTAPVRWLETQAPQPPGRHAYRFDRDWSYLTEQRKDSHG